MTINLGGVPIQDVRVAGVQAQRVMLGTGSTAVEVWSASPYPATGTFEIVNGAAFSPHEVFSHTVVEPGSFTGTLVIESGQYTAIYWYLNGASQGGGLTRTFTGLSVGDTIEVKAMDVSTLNVSGTWSITKN